MIKRSVLDRAREAGAPRGDRRTADAKKAPSRRRRTPSADPSEPRPSRGSPPAKKQVVVSAEHKEAVGRRRALPPGFKFGMSKPIDASIAVLAKSLDGKYDPQINATTDVTQQDKHRKLEAGTRSPS